MSVLTFDARRAEEPCATASNCNWPGAHEQCSGCAGTALALHTCAACAQPGAAERKELYDYVRRHKRIAPQHFRPNVCVCVCVRVCPRPRLDGL